LIARKYFHSSAAAFAVLTLMPLTSTANDSVNRFTLSCTVTDKEGSMADSMEHETGNRILKLSFELQGGRGRYYDFGSEKWFDLVKVTTDELTLDDDNRTSKAIGIFAIRTTISRVTGRYAHHFAKGFTNSGHIWVTDGACEKIKWAPPPAAKF
jgi:hypothetical protein